MGCLPSSAPKGRHVKARGNAPGVRAHRISPERAKWQRLDCALSGLRCSVEILAGCGEEHEVVGQDPEAALPLAGGIGPAAQRAPEPPLVPGEGGLRLPPL